MTFNAHRKILVVGNRWVWEIAARLRGELHWGKSAAFGDQESVRCDAQRRMVVKASPTSTFVMTQAQFVF